MRKSSRWLLAGAALGLLGASMAVPWPFASAELNQHVARQLGALTGLPVKIGGRVTFALLPSPQLKFRDVAIGDGDSPLRIEAAQVKGKLRLLPIIAGRLEVSGLNFQKPLIRIGRNGDTAESLRWPAPAASFTPALGAITISGGRALVASAATGGEAERIDAIDLTMNWQGAAAPAALSGRGAWRGAEIELSVLLGKPRDVLLGRPTPFTFDLKSQIGDMRLDGELSLSPRLQFNGTGSASTERVGRLLKWAEAEPPLATGIERFGLAGSTRILSNSISLSGLTLNVNDNALTGTLTLLRDAGKASLSGTLAAKSLSLDPRGTGWPRLVSGRDGDWSREPLPLGALADLNFDLRLSTNALRLGQIAVGDAALTAMAKDGRAEISFSSARSYDGALKARLSLHTDAAAPRLRAHIQFDRLDAASLLRDALAAQRTAIAGTASGEMEFRSHGFSMHEFLSHAQGAMRTALANGSLNGLDINRALSHYQKQPLSLPSELRNGRTAFARATLGGVMENGVITLADSMSESDALLIRYGGSISLPARTIRLDIDATRPQAPTASMQQTTAAGHAAPQLKLDLAGAWSDPDLRLDVEGLISSSKAAAPLLLRSLKKSADAPLAPASAFSAEMEAGPR